MARMVKMSISLPKELREQLKEYKSINWSRVAREAFKDAIKRSQMREAVRVQDEIREKIRASGVEWSATKEIRKWRERRKGF